LKDVLDSFFTLRDIAVEKTIAEIAGTGAASLPLLEHSFRLALLREAENYPYIPEDEVVGSGDKVVRQEMASFSDFAEDSLYILLRDAFQTWLARQLLRMEPYPFETPLQFNAMMLQKYEPGSIGITPHRDRLSNINLICVFVIAGRGRFFICSDRSAANSVEIDATPGNVILMRAPGFMGLQDRPFHYITGIKEMRYSFGLRQRKS
jgi:hypothetical protein